MSPMNTNTADFKVSEDAALWLHRLAHEDTAEVRAEFAAWIKASAVNLEEFLFAQAAWTELGRLDRSLSSKSMREQDSSIVDFDPDARRQETIGVKGTPRITALRHGIRNSKSRRVYYRAAGIAAGLAAASWMVFTLFVASGGYATKIGEQRSIKLSDGSLMQLNTDSRAKISYSDRQRVIRLLKGEALFTVTRDVRRPFDVITENARVRALGTQFNVYRAKNGATRVAVVDGAVQVTTTSTNNIPAVRLAAGDEANAVQDRIVKSVRADVPRAVAWQARRLVFPGTTVAEIADEFNRYNQIQIRIEGDAVRHRRMSGVFDADDPSPMIQFLTRDPKVETLRLDGEILVRPAR